MARPQLELKTLSNMAYESIKESILKNEMLPGQEVVISSLAASLGISHIPVREAVVRLAADGLMEQTPHRTLRIAGLDENDVHQIYEVRRLLEPHAARCAVQKVGRNPDLLASLKDVLASAERVLSILPDKISLEELVGIDLHLNQIFLDAVDNSLLREILVLIGNRSLRVRTYTEATAPTVDASLIETTTREHIAIIQAIVEGDAGRSCRMVTEHLLNSEGRTTRALRSRLVDSR